MDKRHQVFVSSTYADLVDERRRVIQTLIEMDCIPAGMELFPAADEEQWEFIKRVIDDCDYYILIIGGRYGTSTSEGISYTEKEYDYAIERGLKVLAFIHEKPDEIPVSKSDVDPSLRERLAAFRGKVSKGRLVKSWTSADQLPSLVALSLGKTIKAYPAVGWVRADQVAATEVLSELNTLRKRNQELERIASQIGTGNPTPQVANLAGLDEKVTLSGTIEIMGVKQPWKYNGPWGEVFASLAPYLLANPNDEYVKVKLSSSLKEKAAVQGSSATLNDQDFQTVKVQLMALGLVDVRYAPAVGGGMALFWSLTSHGREMMMQLRTIKSQKPS